MEKSWAPYQWLKVLEQRQEALLLGEEGWERGLPEAPTQGDSLLEENPEKRIPGLARLERIGLDLVREIHEAGPPRPLLFRFDLLAALVRWLAEGHRVLLIGEPGAGKKGLLWQLAYAMAHAPADFPPSLAGRPLILVSASAFQRGVFYMHELENRIELIIQNALQAKAILIVDQVHLLARAGGHELNPERTVANLLLPGLERGLPIIGLTTSNGYTYLLQQAPVFARSFLAMDVPPTTEEETCRILEAMERAWKVQGLEIEAGLVQETLRFLAFLQEAAPGGPTRLLRLARAAQQHPKRLVREDLERALSIHTGIPQFILSRSRPLPFEEVRAFFTQTIYGQEEAITAVADAIVALKAGLIRSDGPWGVFLFLGPSGVGKTELARQAARFLFGSEERLVRCDMGAYIGPEGLARFLGDPAGIRQSPVDLVAAHPFCVLLLDEIEKSDRYLFDALLSILGEGRIVNARGRVVSFRHCLVIMTSNVGSELYLMTHAPSLMPVQANAGLESRLRRQLEKYFRPEFLNRIHRVIVFRPLSPEIVRRIAEREIRALEASIASSRPGLSLEVRPAILERCAAEGYDPALGARPMQRAVDRWVRSPVARLLAARPDLWQGRIVVDLGEDGAPIAYEAGKGRSRPPVSTLHKSR